jgi:hypothetical protein
LLGFAFSPISGAGVVRTFLGGCGPRNRRKST